MKVEKNYSHKEPSPKATLREIRNFYGREEYFTRLFKRLNQTLTEQYGMDRAAEIFKTIGLNVVKVKGLERFYSTGIYSDIGTTAYSKAKVITSKKTAKMVFLEECQKRAEEAIANNEQGVDITAAFLYSTQLVDTDEELLEIGEELIRIFTTCVNNPFVLKLFTKLPEAIENKCNYKHLMALLAKIVKGTLKKSNKQFPIINRVFFIFDNPKEKALMYLKNLYKHDLSEKAMVDCFRHIEDLTSYEPEVCEAFDNFAKVVNRQKPYGEWMHDHIVDMLQETTLTTFQSERRRSELCRRISGDFTKETFEKAGVINSYLWEGAMADTWKPPFLEITFNCAHYSSVEQMLPALNNLIMLSLAKERVSQVGDIVTTRAVHRIILTGCTHYTKEFAEEISEVTRKMRSRYNKEIEIFIDFHPSIVETRTGVAPSEYIRVVSDLHIDVNGKTKYDFDFGNDFIVNCGDTSGNSYLSRDFLQTHLFHGISVAGNHLGYDSIYSRSGCPASIPAKEDPIEAAMNAKNSQVKDLINAFSLTNEITFLEKCGIEKLGVYFLGAVLYTDFSLFGMDNQVACMAEAAKGINDYRNCTVLYADYKKPKGERILVKPWTVNEHQKMHCETKTAFNRILHEQTKNNPDTPVVVVTHFVPTSLAVADQYKNDPLSAAFAVDMTYLIDQFPQIRMFVFGHTHTPFDFIYKERRFVCNPFGYFNENNVDVSEYGTRIKLSDIRSTRPWTEILDREIAEGKVKVY